jgi:hypothetical protein
MKIIELRASNFSRLRAVEIRPDSSLVRINGPNGAGKSSVLRSIWTALVGRAVAPAEPIREGAEKAIIQLDLGKLAVTRTFKRGKHGDYTTDLVVTAEGGSRVTRTPQALIDALLGDLSFDPLAFARLAPKDQFERLKALVPGVDFAALAIERQRLYDERTAVNRRHKDAAARAAGVALPPGPEPAVIDSAALVAKLQTANEQNNRRLMVAGQINEDRQHVERLRDEAEELRSRAAKIEARADEIEAGIEGKQAHLPDVVDTSAITAELASAQRTAEVRRLHQARREQLDIVGETEGQTQELTAAIDALDAGARDAIAKANLPAGLALDAQAGAVLLNGLPFSQAGTAEKIMASAQTAMALNPDLRVMLIDEGSELDRATLAMLEELAGAHDYQVWVARVEEGERGPGFRIEDGTVASGGQDHPFISDAAIDRSKQRPQR